MSVLSSSPLFQVVDKGSHCRIALLRELLDALEVILMGVPAGQRDLDEGDAGFDKPPRQQAAVAEATGAVGFARRGRLLRQVERLGFFRLHERDGASIDRLVIRTGFGPIVAIKGRLHFLQKF